MVRHLSIAKSWPNEDLCNPASLPPTPSSNAGDLSDENSCSLVHLVIIVADIDRDGLLACHGT